MGKAKVSTGHVDTIVKRIIFDFPTYSKQQLVKLVEFCVASIRDNHDEIYRWNNFLLLQPARFSNYYKFLMKCLCPSWKDLLPVLLETLETEKYVTRLDVEVSGAEYKSLTVKEICNCTWNGDILPSLAQMFG